MKFKIDENMPLEVKNIILEKGHDCESVYDENLNGKPDLLVACKCSEENRILITLDLDFANIIQYPMDKYPSRIILRPNRQSKHHIIQFTGKFLENKMIDNENRHIYIVEEDRVRIR